MNKMVVGWVIYPSCLAKLARPRPPDTLGLRVVVICAGTRAFHRSNAHILPRLLPPVPPIVQGLGGLCGGCSGVLGVPCPFALGTGELLAIPSHPIPPNTALFFFPPSARRFCPVCGHEPSSLGVLCRPKFPSPWNRR